MTQSWTLAVEITFYLMLPAYALLMRRLGAGRDPDARLRLELTGAVALYLVSVGWRTLVFYGGVLPGRRAALAAGLPRHLRARHGARRGARVDDAHGWSASR